MTSQLGWSQAHWLARRRTPNDALRFWATIASAAIASSLLCLAISLATQGWDQQDQVDSTIAVIADGGTRGGAAFAVLLVALPALYLTGQSWHLGSVERRERLAQLRDAGAGPHDLRRIAIADTTIPASLGAAGGVLILVAAVSALNLWRSYQPVYRKMPTGGWEATGAIVWVPLRDVIPNPLLSTPWAAPLAVLAVAAAATWAAARASRTAHRRSPRRRGLIAATAAILAGRARTPALIMALRRLADDPRTTARPGALLFLASFVAFASSWLASGFRAFVGEQRWLGDSYYSQAFTLVRWATVIGLILCALGLVVSLGDAVVRHRRADAVAIATGVPTRVLRRALVLQALLPALPLMVLGALLGAGASISVTGTMVQQGGELNAPIVAVPIPWLEWLTWTAGITLAAVAAALLASTLLSRTTRTDQLRIPA